MPFLNNTSKNDLVMGFAAAAVVLLSGLTMTHLTSGANTYAQMAPVAPAAMGAGDIVSQNAIAPSQSGDLPAIAAGDACPISLDLLDDGNAMIGGTLLAPCLPGQNLVIAHAGMVYSAKTLASGALFFSLPALKHPASVDIRFSNGETASASVDIPDAAQVHRVAVQWPFEDGFTLHAFENGAAFGDIGHIWAQNANLPLAGAAAKGGYLTQLGDASVETPLMAQVFTFDPKEKSEILLEAAVTANTCAAELLGDVLVAKGGAVEKTEITLAMPDCSAVGEFVQLGLPDFGVDLALVN